MASANDWLEGARLRTLPAAAAPVFVGGGAAHHLGAFSWGMTTVALVVALALQVGVNLANDYSDGIRGTDRDRVGPARLTANGVVSPQTVLTAALSCFAVAGIAGAALVAWSGQWWLLGVGIAAILAAWFYTGGRHPYGYLGVGLSELLVFVFFGLVATVGTTYVQTGVAPWWVWAAGTGMGMISIALLMVNNIRDIDTDLVARKYTLAVRLGDDVSRAIYIALIVGAAIVGAVAQAGTGLSMQGSVAVGFVLMAAGAPGALAVRRGVRGQALLGVLRNTGLYALVYGLVMGAAFVFGVAGIA